MKRHKALVSFIWSLTLSWVLVMALLLWPYSDVTFPKGSVATVSPSTVRELDTITVTYPQFCNYGQVTTTERWADIYNPDGVQVASEKLGTLTFYPVRDEPCREPEVQDVGLTTAFKAYNGEPTTYRIRTVTTYKPNWIRTVEVDATTEPFVVIPR